MTAAKHCPLFITFEGGEGAGKTSLISLLQKELTKQGYQVVTTREPGSTPLGEKIRHLLLQHEAAVHINPLSELLLFLAARSQHIEEVIAPALAAGKIVLCDRFNDSTIAYQGIAREIGESRVRRWCEDVCQGTMPDMTLFLDVDPQIGMERAAKQGRTIDRMENEKSFFHEKVRQGFLALAAKDASRIVVVDASQSPQDVFEQSMNPILEKIGKRKVHP